ncbi:hypothetical protein [Jannaschia marina]|uniref:hypothetical protein n=1 Tax=Jannaschia marina TaxID=2741674 RepID=UPI0015CB8AC3|nr:hypothetical protein [Jannaschia marina]
MADIDLQDGERLLWSGRGRPPPMIGPELVAVGVFTAIMALVATGLGRALARDLGTPVWTWTLGALVVGGLIAVLLVGLLRWRAGRIRYVLTDRRALVLGASPGVRLPQDDTGWPLDEMTEPRLVSHADGSGSILFGRRPVARVRRARAGRSRSDGGRGLRPTGAGKHRSTDVGFERIDGAAEVFALLEAHR